MSLSQGQRPGCSISMRLNLGVRLDHYPERILYSKKSYHEMVNGNSRRRLNALAVMVVAAEPSPNDLIC